PHHRKPASPPPPTGACLLGPPNDRRPIRRLAAGARLLHGLEDVAGRGQLRQEDDLRFHRPHLPDGALRVIAVPLAVAHPGGKLHARHPDTCHRPRFTSTPPTRQDQPPWSSPSSPPTSQS